MEKIFKEHFNFNYLIDAAYKIRDLDECKRLCKDDLSILNEFLSAWKKRFGTNSPLPQIPSITRLAIIYENEGLYNEAIALCDLGLSLNLSDGTKGGYLARKTKLNKKLLMQSPTI